MTVELTNWQERARLAADRADRAQESLGRLRERAGQHKATADRRLDLLLSTVEGAVSGLRREWDLAGGGVDPADLVVGRLPGSGAVPESTGEPSRRYAWLGLPAAHLIVDGYNVSKTGYPDLTLAQQRERLVRQLAALSARTSAEVTVVFDAAPGRHCRCPPLAFCTSSRNDRCRVDLEASCTSIATVVRSAVPLVPTVSSRFCSVCPIIGSSGTTPSSMLSGCWRPPVWCRPSGWSSPSIRRADRPAEGGA